MVTRTLWLAMWNHDTFGHNDFLGEVMLPLETYQESGFSWDDPSPNWYPLHERVIHCMHLYRTQIRNEPIRSRSTVLILCLIKSLT